MDHLKYFLNNRNRRQIQNLERNKFNHHTTGSNQLVSSEKETKEKQRSKQEQKLPIANVSGQITSN